MVGSLPNGKNAYCRSHTRKSIIIWLRSEYSSHDSTVCITIVEAIIVGVEIAKPVNIMKPRIRTDTSINNGDCLSFPPCKVLNRSSVYKRMELLRLYMCRKRR